MNPQCEPDLDAVLRHLCPQEPRWPYAGRLQCALSPNPLRIAIVIVRRVTNPDEGAETGRVAVSHSGRPIGDFLGGLYIGCAPMPSPVRELFQFNPQDFATSKVWVVQKLNGSWLSACAKRIFGTRPDVSVLRQSLYTFVRPR